MILKEILTKNLIIKAIEKSNADFIFELLNTEGWLRNIGERHITTVEVAEQYIQKIILRENFDYLVVKLIDTEVPIGIISIIKREGYTHFDIGFAFLPKYTNNGYAFEASYAVLKTLAASKIHDKILGIYLEANLPSINLLKKLGMTLEKKIFENNQELVLYSIVF